MHETEELTSVFIICFYQYLVGRIRESDGPYLARGP